MIVKEDLSLRLSVKTGEGVVEEEEEEEEEEERVSMSKDWNLSGRGVSDCNKSIIARVVGLEEKVGEEMAEDCEVMEMIGMRIWKGRELREMSLLQVFSLQR
jgi:hypothetical protein